MGNKPFKIGVQLDRLQYRAGDDDVTGTVYLSVADRRAVRDRFVGIHLLLEGHEHVETVRKPHHDVNPHGGSRRRRHRRYDDCDDDEPVIERSTSTLIRTDSPIVTWGDNGDHDDTTPAEGQYEYPFRWRLPDHLPATMHCQDKSDARSFCEVRYTLTAYLVPLESSQASTTSYGRNSTIEDRRAFTSLCVVPQSPTTQQQQQQQQHPIVMPAEAFPITSCWFWEKGSIELGWQMESNAGCPDQPAPPIHIIGSNSSVLDVKQLRVKWVETVTWKTRGRYDHRDGASLLTAAPRSMTNTRTLAEETIPVKDVAGWKPFYTRNNNGPRHRAPSLYHWPQHQYETAVSRLHLPASSRYTYTGDLVSVRHMIVVSAETAGGCTTTSPEVCCEVKVVSQQLSQGDIHDHNNSSLPIPTIIDDGAQHEDVYHQLITSTNDLVQQQQQQQHQHDNEQAGPTLVHAQALPDDWQPDAVAQVVQLPPEAAAVILVDDQQDTTKNNSSSSGGGRVAGSSSSSGASPTDDTSSRSNSNSHMRHYSQASAPDESLLDSSSSGMAAGKDNYDGNQHSRAEAIAAAATTPHPPSVQQLQMLVSESSENLPVLLQDGVWATLVQNLSPHDYAAIVRSTCCCDLGGNVKNKSTVMQHGGRSSNKTMDSPACTAETLAMTMGPSFSCRHLLACLWAMPHQAPIDSTANSASVGAMQQEQRMEVLRRVAPLAADLDVNFPLLEQGLTPVEMRHLRAALH